MAFNPLLPADGSLIVAAELRGQFTGLHDEIVAVPVVTGAQVDTTVTLAPGSMATATAQLTAGIVHFDFAIPVGIDGATGPPGEVTQTQLANDLLNSQNATMLAILPQTSANSNAVPNVSGTVSNPPT